MRYLKGFFTSASLSTVFMCFSATAVAQSEDAEPWLLAKYDLNGDATITQQEVTYKKQMLFNRMDTNQDGDVSFDEYESMDHAKRQALLKSRFSKLDEDHDGKVSQAEYASYLGMFSSIDVNGDGTLSKDEVGSTEKMEAKVTRCLLWLCVRTSLD